MEGLKKIYIFIYMSVCVQISLSAQSNNEFFVDTTQHLSVSLKANYDYGSNVMNSEFFNKFLFGGRIERELKDKVYKNLSGRNQLGGDLNYRLNIEVPFDSLFRKPNLSLIIGVENVEHLSATFTSDLFKLAFDGNKQFAGQYADIGGTNYNYLKYQQINMGFVNYKYYEDRLAKEGVVLSVIKGEENEAITIPYGNLYTEDLGKEIELDINYAYNSTDTAKKGITAFNGYGVSTDLFTEYYFNNSDKIYFGVEDIGFIHWNKKSVERRTDNVYHYDGIWINDIFELNDSLLNKISKDSLINSVSEINQKSDYSIALPTAININYTKVLNNKWKLNFGIYHKILSNYFPFIYTNMYYYVNNKFVVKAHVSYGGYGKLNTGLALAKSINKYAEIFIGTNNIETFIVPESSYNNSGFIGIKSYF